jgi:hypothetical protein
MTDPLVVDPSRLKDAGNTLGALVLPAAPPPIAVAGADPMSAAISETLPVIESPVVAGLPAVQAAMTRTGSNIVIAAGMYADTDQRLGDHLSQVQVVAADEKRSRTTGQLLGATAAADGEAADEPANGAAPTPTPAQPVVPQSGLDQLRQQAGQVAAVAGAMGPATQTMQPIMSAVQGAMGNVGGAGGAGAPAAQAQLVDETKPDDEERERITEGAAPGDQSLESTPIQAPTPGRPQVTPSGIEL